MRLYRFFILFVLYSLIALPSFTQQRKFSFSQNKMGSPFNIILVASDSLYAANLASQCFSLIDSFNHIYSDYDSTSELSKLCANTTGKPITVSPALLTILLLSKNAYYKSLHSFDISIGPLSMLWRKSRKNKQFPNPEQVASIKKLVGFEYLIIDSATSTVLLTKKGMQLDLGGIAKGYLAQIIIDFLHNKGTHAALADAGGDIATSDAPPNSKGWLIGVNVPEQTDVLLKGKLQISNIAVATSGDAYQFIEHNGKKYAHITDPRTGYGVSFQRNVTVIARDGATADWLATACSILPISLAKKIARKEKAAVLITVLKNEKIKAYQTHGFAKYWQHTNE